MSKIRALLNKLHKRILPAPKPLTLSQALDYSLSLGRCPEVWQWIES